MSDQSSNKQPNASTADVSDVPLDKLRSLITHLRALETHPGWLYIRKVLESQAAMRFATMARAQPYCTRDMIEQAGLRGEANAQESLITYPEFLIANMETQLQAAGVELDEEPSDA